MKLSAHDRQRLQWGLAVLIGGTAVLYAYIHLMIVPLMQVRVEGLNRLAEYQEQIDKATLDLRSLEAVKAEVATLQAGLAVITNRFVICPVLGSTLVTVQSIVEPIAQECGLRIESCVERGRMEAPVNKKDAGFVIDRYLVELTGSGEYAAVRDFVQTLEQTNAYVCVTDVEILGRGEDAMRHKARICMEWPVFGEHKAAEAAPARARAGVGARMEDRP